jgi:hypothetical protein
VIYLNDTTFRRYILQGPRAYSALLMITSNTDQLPCQPCRSFFSLSQSSVQCHWFYEFRVLTKEFKKVATAYKRQIHGVYTDFFFVIADVANCTEEITKLKVPFLFWIWRCSQLSKCVNILFQSFTKSQHGKNHQKKHKFFWIISWTLWFILYCFV